MNNDEIIETPVEEVTVVTEQPVEVSTEESNELILRFPIKSGEFLSELVDENPTTNGYSLSENANNIIVDYLNDIGYNDVTISGIEILKDQILEDSSETEFVENILGDEFVYVTLRLPEKFDRSRFIESLNTIFTNYVIVDKKPELPISEDVVAVKDFVVSGSDVNCVVKRGQSIKLLKDINDNIILNFKSDKNNVMIVDINNQNLLRSLINVIGKPSKKRVFKNINLNSLKDKFDKNHIIKLYDAKVVVDNNSSETDVSVKCRNISKYSFRSLRSKFYNMNPVSISRDINRYNALSINSTDLNEPDDMIIKLTLDDIVPEEFKEGFELINEDDKPIALDEIEVESFDNSDPTKLVVDIKNDEDSEIEISDKAKENLPENIIIQGNELIINQSNESSEEVVNNEDSSESPKLDASDSNENCDDKNCDDKNKIKNDKNETIKEPKEKLEEEVKKIDSKGEEIDPENSELKDNDFKEDKKLKDSNKKVKLNKNDESVEEVSDSSIDVSTDTNEDEDSSEEVVTENLNIDSEVEGKDIIDALDDAGFKIVKSDEETIETEGGDLNSVKKFKKSLLALNRNNKSKRFNKNDSDESESDNDSKDSDNIVEEDIDINPETDGSEIIQAIEDAGFEIKKIENGEAEVEGGDLNSVRRVKRKLYFLNKNSKLKRFNKNDSLNDEGETVRDEKILKGEASKAESDKDELDGDELKDHDFEENKELEVNSLIKKQRGRLNSKSFKHQGEVDVDLDKENSKHNFKLSKNKKNKFNKNNVEEEEVVTENVDIDPEVDGLEILQAIEDAGFKIEKVNDSVAEVTAPDENSIRLFRKQYLAKYNRNNKNRFNDSFKSGKLALNKNEDEKSKLSDDEKKKLLEENPDLELVEDSEGKTEIRKKSDENINTQSNTNTINIKKSDNLKLDKNADGDEEVGGSESEPVEESVEVDTSVEVNPESDTEEIQLPDHNITLDKSKLTIKDSEVLTPMLKEYNIKTKSDDETGQFEILFMETSAENFMNFFRNITPEVKDILQKYSTEFNNDATKSLDELQDTDVSTEITE